MARKLKVFGFKEGQYVKNTDVTNSQMAKDYNRMRKAWQDREEAFKRSEFTWTQTYKQNVGKYDLPASAYTPAQLKKKWIQLHDVLAAETGSVRGLQHQRKEAIKSINKKMGNNFLNNDNFRSFTDFMDDFRAKYGNVKYDSETLEEFFDVIYNEKDLDEFDDEFQLTFNEYYPDYYQEWEQKKNAENRKVASEKLKRFKHRRKKSFHRK